MITISCVYFKPSGKLYTSGTEEFDESLFEDCIYPVEYGRRLNQLQLLPGLQSGSWNDRPFTVDVQDKYVELVIPIEMRPRGEQDSE